MITIFCDFSHFFGEKIGGFCSKKPMLFFHNVCSFESKRQFFADFFGKNIFRNRNIGPTSEPGKTPFFSSSVR
jgi:hypothetical protein